MIRLLALSLLVGCVSGAGGIVPDFGETYHCHLIPDATHVEDFDDCATHDGIRAMLIEWYDECSQEHAAAGTSWICGGDCRAQDFSICTIDDGN